MTKKELENEISKRIKEIRDLYYKEYPQGDYLGIAIFKDIYWFNNKHNKEDMNYPLNYIDKEN